MIVKYLPKRGGGSIKATLNYLLGGNWEKHPEQAERANAKVLKGDPLLTQLIANSSPYKDTYTVGVLSFEEKGEALSDDIKNEIMAEFERVTFAGLEDDQFNICWIEHTDKDGRLELNFVIPKVELSSGKHFNPFVAAADMKRINTFKKYINAKYDLADPDDPGRRQNTKIKNTLPKTKKEFKADLDDLITDGINQEIIKNRDDVIQYLEEVVGLSIARQTDKSISIANPNGGQNIRLTGAYYERHFKAEAGTSQEQATRASDNYHRRRDQRLEASKNRLDRYIERRKEYNQKRYPRSIQPRDFDSSQEHRAASNRSNEVTRNPLHQNFRPEQPANLQTSTTSLASQNPRLAEATTTRHGQLQQPLPSDTPSSANGNPSNPANQPSTTATAARPNTHQTAPQSRDVGHQIPHSDSDSFNIINPDNPSLGHHDVDTARHLYRPQEQRPQPIATDGTYNPYHQQRGEQDQNHHASVDIPSQRDHALLHSGNQIYPREPQQSRVTGQSDLGGHHHPDSRTTNSLSLSQHTQGAVNEQSIFNAIDGQIERYATRIPKSLERQAARDRRTTSRADAQKQYDSTVATTADRGTKIKSELQKLGTENAGMERLLQQFDSETAVTSDRVKELSNATGASQQQNKRADTAISESKAGLRNTATRLQDEFGRSVRERFDEFRTQFKRHLDDRIAGLQDYLRPFKERGQRIPQTINRITEQFADITQRIKAIKDEFMRGDWLHADTGKPLTKEEKEQIREFTPATRLKQMMKEAEKSRDRGGPSR